MRGIRNDAIRHLVQTAQEQGWEIEMRRGGHIMLHNPKTKFTTIASGTARGHRNAMNLRAALRRGGLDG